MKMKKLIAILLLLTASAFAQDRKGTWLMKSADVNIAASGDNTVIAAVSGKRIVVFKFWCVANGLVNLKFKDGASTDFNANAIHLTADGSSIFFPYDSEPYWITTAGNAFLINLSGAVQVSGRIYYMELP